MARGGGFEDIFAARYPMVWRVLHRLGVREADAEDLCQEVFLVVLRRIDTFKGEAEFGTWLYGICLRVASDYRRRAYVRRERVTSPALLQDSDAPATQQQTLEAAESQRLLSELLGELPQEQREALVLVDLEELSYADAAACVRVPVSTITMRLRSARLALNEAAARWRRRNDR